jgi:serine protease inhibitor
MVCTQPKTTIDHHSQKQLPMKYYLLTVMAFALVVLASCKKEDIEQKNDYKPIVVDEKTASMVSANNEFGLKLFKTLASNGSNVFVSPLSVSQALGMTYNGATGNTATEMASVLGFGGMTSGDINQTSTKLRQALLGADKTVSFSIANSIWYRNDFSINADFVTTNKTYYDAEVKGLDFSKAEASKNAINSWVNDQTRGKIPTIVDQITPDHVMFLINAVYFKGTWKFNFKKSDTATMPFYNNGTEEVDVQMMTQECDLGYYADHKVAAVEMPYGNEHFSMIVILPQNDNTLASSVGLLTSAYWQTIVSGMQTSGIKLYMPKFKNECDLELNEPLIDLGMPLAFSDMAEFPNMGTPSNLCIGKVKHKTFVEISEEGTEAAAVTSVEMTFTSIGPTPTPTYLPFKVDKPFVYAIKEKDTGAIVFIGQTTKL